MIKTMSPAGDEKSPAIVVTFAKLSPSTLFFLESAALTHCSQQALA